MLDGLCDCPISSKSDDCMWVVTEIWCKYIKIAKCILLYIMYIYIYIYIYTYKLQGHHAGQRVIHADQAAADEFKDFANKL